MRLLLYSVLRLLLLVAALVLLHVLGLRSWLLWFVAIVVAALLSYVLLPRLRDAAALQIADTVQRRPRQPKPVRRRDEDADYEDAMIDSTVFEDGTSVAPGKRAVGNQAGGIAPVQESTRPGAPEDSRPGAPEQVDDVDGSSRR